MAVRNHRLVAELEAKAALEERNRIARELHDSVSQLLFSLSLRSKAVRLANEHAGSGSRERVRDGLDEIQGLTTKVLGEMRAMIAQLRPSELEQGGIVGAIRRHVDALAARSDLDIVVRADDDLPALSELCQIELFRVVQEALNNVVRHANALQRNSLDSALGSGRRRSSRGRRPRVRHRARQGRPLRPAQHAGAMPEARCKPDRFECPRVHLCAC